MNWIELHYCRGHGYGYCAKGEPVVINKNNIKYIEGKENCLIKFIDGSTLRVYEDYDEIIKGDR